MDEDTEYGDERQFPRVAFPRTNWVFALKIHQDALIASPIQLEAQNISQSGMRFQSNKKIPIFGMVTVQLLDKEGKKSPITLEGKVIRVDETDVGHVEKTFGMAIEFIKIPTKFQQALKEELGPLLATEKPGEIKRK